MSLFIGSLINYQCNQIIKQNSLIQQQETLRTITEVMQESFNKIYQYSPSSTFRQNYTPMSRLDQLLIKNQQIYQNLKLKLTDIAESNMKIDRNISNMKPLYDYAESGRSSKQNKNMFKDEKDSKQLKQSQRSSQQSPEFMKRKLQIMFEVQRQSKARANYNELQLVRQLSNQQVQHHNYFQQRIVDGKISLQSSRPIQKGQNMESSRLSSMQAFTPQQYRQNESSEIRQVPKHKTNRVYIQNPQKSSKQNEYRKSFTINRQHNKYYQQSSSAIAEQGIGLSNQTFNSKYQQQEMTFNQRQHKSASLRKNEESIRKISPPLKSYIMIKQSDEGMSSPRVRNDYLEKQFDKSSNAYIMHSSPNSRNLNISKLSDNQEKKINIVIRSNKKLLNIEESFRSGETKINEHKVVQKSQIRPCKSHSRTKYGEKFCVSSKLFQESKIRKQQVRFIAKVKQYMYVPLNKLYTSAVLQMKNPTTLLLARKSKTSMAQHSSAGRIIDGTLYKYKKGVIYTDQNELVDRLINQNTVELFQQTQFGSQALKKFKRGKNISIAFVGGRDTRKKKLHVEVVNRAITDLDQVVSNYIDLSFHNNYTSKITISVQHREILSLIGDPQSFQQEFVFNVPLDQRDKQACYRTFQQLRKSLNSICQTIKMNDDDIISSYKHISLGQKQRKKCKRLRITKIQAQLVTRVNIEQSKLSLNSKQARQERDSNYQSPARVTKNKILYNLQVISTNRYDLEFIRCLEAQKIVWCINPLLKNYDITRDTLNAMNSFMKPGQKQNRSISRRKAN